MIVKKTILLTMLMVFAVQAVGCSDSSMADASKNVFPIPDVPKELTAEFDTISGILASVEGEQGTVVEQPVSDNTPVSIRDKSIQVYFDNTSTCFNYLENQNKDANAWNAFAGSMKAYKNTFESAKSFTVHTLQLDGGHFVWNSFPENDPAIFTRYNEPGMYTTGSGIDFPEKESPMTMWLDLLEQQTGADAPVSIYISDLNEQWITLSPCGRRLRDLLDKQPARDFLIISYRLRFTGKVYQASLSLELQGSGGSSGESSLEDVIIARNYYAVAYGDTETLRAIADEISNNFAEIAALTEIEMDTEIFLYSDYQKSVKQETVNEVIDLLGRSVDDSLFIDTPPRFSILNENGDVIEEADAVMQETEAATPQQGGGLGGGLDVGSNGEGDSSVPVLHNLYLYPDVADRFEPELTGQVYGFENVVPGIDKAGTELSLRLENTDLYQLDTDGAVVYTYNVPSEQLSSDQTAGWVRGDPKSELAVVKCKDNTVTVTLSDKLTADAVPVIVISVPVTFQYAVKTFVTAYAGTEEVSALVERCNKPVNPKEDDNDARYGRTYDFDAFMNHITDYKKISAMEAISEDIQQGYTMTPERLNFIIVSESGLSK